MALLCLRTTPIDHQLLSPVELLLGRAIQDNLPRKIPSDALNEVVTPRLEERQDLQKFFHDRSARQLPELTPGQKVCIQEQSTLKWKASEVRETFAGVPPSYAVTTPTGRELRRTRTHIQLAIQSNIEVGPDADEQTVVQAATNPTIAIAAPPENQATALPDSYVTRNGRISKPPERLYI